MEVICFYFLTDGKQHKAHKLDMIIDTLRYFKMNFQMRDNGPTYNVLDVWKMGYTGRGVVVGVVDDGLEKDHPELKDNYVSTRIYQTDNCM